MDKYKKKVIFLSIIFTFFIFIVFNSYADTVVTTTTTYPYFRTGDNAIGTLFYFLGDLVALPFRLLGDLFVRAF